MDKNAVTHGEFHRISLDALRGLIRENKISAQLADSLLQYWRKRLDDSNDALYADYIEYYLFFEAMHGLFLGLYIFDLQTSAVRHSYGIFPTLSASVFKTIDNLPDSSTRSVAFEHGTHELRLHNLHCGFGNQNFLIAVLSVKDYDLSAHLKRLRYVFERFYLPSSFSRDERVALLFSETETVIGDLIRPALAQGLPVTFTYLYFESTSKYVGLAGENFAKELIQELQKDVHRILKDTDNSIILSPREILIVSLNCDKSIMQNRFASAYFHAQSLLMAFQVNFFTATKPVTDLGALWGEITGNIAYKRKLK